MAIRIVRKRGDELLGVRAKEVSRFDHTLVRIIDDMYDTMHHYHGIGLAAPQIGISKRIIVAEVDDVKLALVNPEIIAGAGEEVDVEGCLSWPGNFGEVLRKTHIKVRGHTALGEEVEIVAEGLLARCLQHEIDHLNGVLFCDVALRLLDKSERQGLSDE